MTAGAVCGLAVLLSAAAGAAADAPGSVDDATRFVERQVEGIRASPGPKPPRAYTVTLAAMQYVQTRLSAALYSAMGAAGEPLPQTTQEALALQAGICGHHVDLFLQILERLDVEAMPVQIFFTAGGIRQNHAAAEVRWRGRWHFVDISYGAVFWRRPGRLWSLDRLLADPEPMRWAHRNELDAWTDSALLKGWDPYNYLRGFSRREVVHLGRGTVTVPARGSRARMTRRAEYDLTLLPDYIGTLAPYASKLVTVSYRLAIPRGAASITLRLRTRGCPGGGHVEVAGPAGTARVDLAELPWAGAATLPADGGSTVTVRVRGRVAQSPCALVVDGISAS